MTRLPIVLVAAVAQNGVIGADNKLLWRLSSDLKRFKALTLGKPLIMGRKTFQSIGRPLPGRETIVVTRDPGLLLKSALVVHGLDAALALAEARAAAMGADAIVIAGGGELYAATIALADRLAITEVALAPEGGAHFPPIDPAEWREVRREPGVRGPNDEADFAFVDYVRARTRSPGAKRDRPCRSRTTGVDWAINAWPSGRVSTYCRSMAVESVRLAPSIQSLSGASLGPWVSPPQPRPFGACAQAAMATAVLPSADQIGAPDSPEQAPAGRPLGSAAQTRTVEAGARTARVTARSAPPDFQSPSRVAPKPVRMTGSPTEGPSSDASVAPTKRSSRGRAVLTSATSTDSTRSRIASGRYCGCASVASTGTTIGAPEASR